MQTNLDLDLLQTLASKICHDLISPIGAIGNGLEFMEEMGPDAFDDASELIGHSARQASSKLQLYRIAYGAGGADGHIKPEEVKKALDGLLQGDGKITQDWDEHVAMGIADNGIERLPAFAKILTCTLLLAIDTLPKGGVISVEANGSATTVISKGPNAAFRDNIPAALSLSLPNDTIETKLAHAVISGMLGAHYGYSFSTESDTDQTSITFTV